MENENNEIEPIVSQEYLDALEEEHEETKEEKIARLEQEIRNLTSDLTSPVSSIGDYKVIKCYEASILSQELPYDIETLHEQRQRVRTQINDIQQQIEELKNS